MITNPIFQKYLAEVDSIYDALVKQDEESGQPYSGGKDAKGIPNGRGKMRYPDGSEYEGTFFMGLRHGKGKYRFISADPDERLLYEGDWLNDKMEGVGVLAFKNGDKYEGCLKNGKHEGFGVYLWAIGDKYDGEWKDDKRHGKGIYTWSTGAKYEGGWQKSLKHGKAFFYNSDGSKTEEEWKDGLKVAGTGTFTLKDGGEFIGELKDGKRTGIGTFNFPQSDAEGRLKFEGEWLNDLFNGNGTLIWKNKKKYVGAWKEGKKEGLGNEYDEKGKLIFEGVFKNNKYAKGKYYSDSMDTCGNHILEGDFDESGNLINGIWAFEGRSFNNGYFRVEVIGNRPVRGSLGNNEGGSFEGEVRGDNAEQAEIWNGYSNGYGNSKGYVFGEVRNGNLEGNGKISYQEDWFCKTNETYGKILEIAGYFSNGNVLGECRLTFKSGLIRNGYGDGFGGLKVI